MEHESITRCTVVVWLIVFLPGGEETFRLEWRGLGVAAEAGQFRPEESLNMGYSDNILRRVMLPNGTFKTTWRHRLDDLNAFVLPFISELPGRLNVMDVAASSGSTTAEWSEHLSRAGIDFDISATDKAPYAYRISLFPGITALVDEARNPLYFSVLGHGVSPRVKGLKAPAKLFLRAMLKANRRSLNSAVPLASGLPVIEDDLLAPNRPEWIRTFDVIRAANILNRAYFPEITLRTIVGTLLERIRPGGLLIVSRTAEDDNRNYASLFQLNGTQLEIIARLNGGSEIEAVIPCSPTHGPHTGPL